MKYLLSIVLLALIGVTTPKKTTPAYDWVDKSMTADNDKLFPFGIVPMFTLSNTRFGDIYTYLATVQGMYKFCK